MPFSIFKVLASPRSLDDYIISVRQTIPLNQDIKQCVSSKINITGDKYDYFIFLWDTDGNASNGYQGQDKFQSGGAIPPGPAFGAPS